MDEEAGEVRPAAAFELETEPTPAHGRKQTGWWRPPSGVTGGAVGVALVLLLLSGVATSRSGGEGEPEASDLEGRRAEDPSDHG